MRAQEAFDSLGLRLGESNSCFDQAVQNIPSWSDAVDMHVKQYVAGVKDIVKANLHWSFRTQRHFGSKREEVRQTGRIDVLKHPSYLLRK